VTGARIAQIGPVSEPSPNMPVTEPHRLWRLCRWLDAARFERENGSRRFGFHDRTRRLAFNTDKVLLGRFWGAEVLGIYGRAYQLISLPTQNLTSTMGQVAVPALSRRTSSRRTAQSSKILSPRRSRSIIALEASLLHTLLMRCCA